MVNFASAFLYAVAFATTTATASSVDQVHSRALGRDAALGLHRASSYESSPGDLVSARTPQREHAAATAAAKSGADKLRRVVEL